MRSATGTDAALRLLGLAARAGGVVAGTDLLRRAVHHGEVRFALVATDLTANGRDRIIPLLERAAVPFAEPCTRAALGSALGRGNLGAVGVTEPRLAQEIQRKLGVAGTTSRQRGSND